MPKDEQAPKKSSVLKWVLGCGALVVIIGVLAVIAVSVLIYKSVALDPVEAKKVADTIVPFDLPEGYEMVFANRYGLKMAMFMSKDDHDKNLQCFMMYFPASWGTDREKMESQMDQQMRKQGKQGNMSVKEQKVVTVEVRGEDVKASKATLVAEDGAEHVRYQLFIDADKGSIMIQIQGASEGFDEDAMDDFLDSIK